MNIKLTTPEELFQKMSAHEKVILLDVRAEEKYHDFHIDGPNVDSYNIHKEEIFNLEKAEDLDNESLPKDKEIIVTCTTGNSATKCANVLSERNYNVTVLEGGITAWKEYLKTK
ncbi:rhodanese-like domain-containing protein [Lederbergia wuyishanensis]|uniref:Hydroxyacylglutathione hydrolase n=1 Tax=Lederbergia wuyishanensis TaxID=1347903 RepID=A0ABU0D2E2_9BACI|nr:rhodanese-like domain-containing protein [Lederbergia wuyishanensis]MCJ8007268.1 rhodanese-like domain-containing protein [Lederbergia wuyishanensis]MDQ0342578.1 hydroxyacylglutathione hydrolase [Lederbergia wuyishanensis]